MKHNDTKEHEEFPEFTDKKMECNFAPTCTECPYWDEQAGVCMANDKDDGTIPIDILMKRG